MRDPVCGMTVGVGALTVAAHPEYGFCSEHCRRAFLASPERFSGASDAGSGEQAHECCGGKKGHRNTTADRA